MSRLQTTIQILAATATAALTLNAQTLNILHVFSRMSVDTTRRRA